MREEEGRKRRRGRKALNSQSKEHKKEWDRNKHIPLRSPDLGKSTKVTRHQLPPFTQTSEN